MKFTKREQKQFDEAVGLVYQIIITENDYGNRSGKELSGFHKEYDCCICNLSKNLAYFPYNTILPYVEKYVAYFNFPEHSQLHSVSNSLGQMLMYCPDNILCVACLESYRILPLQEHKIAIEKRILDFSKNLKWTKRTFSI